MRYSPLLLKYLKAYQLNPTSQVFAPLAESYRKLGMVSEALKVLKKGLFHHPNHLLANIVLATCYYDLGKFAVAKQVLERFIPLHLDNLLLQSLYAEICEQVGEGKEALKIYKYLLFINPKKMEWQKKVDALEKRWGSSPEDIIAPEMVGEEDNNQESPVSVIPSDEWQSVSWVGNRIDEVSQRQEMAWKMESPSVVEKTEKVESTSEISYGLVDLYVKQGHVEKALQILEKIRKLNPHDVSVEERWQKLKLAQKETQFSTFCHHFEERCQLLLQKFKQRGQLDIIAA